VLVKIWKEAEAMLTRQIRSSAGSSVGHLHAPCLAAKASLALEDLNSESPLRRVVAMGSLPAIRKDPFDRLLVAQATVEGITLLTLDPVVAEYPGPVRRASA
jgi:hypothetical protein